MEHAHHHIHAEPENGKSRTRLLIALFLTAGYMVVEAVGGFLFNSLALLADSGHMLSDVMALGLSWFALHIGQRSPTDRHTFGFKRTEILAALMNGVALWAIVAVLFYEAVRRFFQP
ncbi:MAG: cation diffusion facilitator family transporter, partial [Desulfomonilaceae bacterium]